MSGGILQVLTAPRQFFAEEAESPSALYPAAIVASLAVLGLIQQAVAFSQVSGAFTGEFAEILLVVQAVVAVFTGALPFIVWLLYAVAFFVVSLFFDGEGSFRDVALLSAWGFLPRIAESVVGIAATVVAYQGQEVPPIEDPEAFTEFTAELASHPANVAASVVGLALLLWSAYVWVAAVQESRHLDRREATITVAVPVAVAVLFRLAGLGVV